jgi:Rrf2 family protein
MANNTRFATGIHALVILTRDPGKLHSSETIALKLNTNPVVIRRILAQLQGAGLVRNHKGPSGGSELIRPANKITLGDVYRVTDPGPLFSEAKIKGTQAKKIALEMRKVQESAEKALLGSLDEISIEQLSRRSARK